MAERRKNEWNERERGREKMRDLFINNDIYVASFLYTLRKKAGLGIGVNARLCQASFWKKTKTKN